MAEQLDLETLHHILEQYSDDVLADCHKILCKLLNSLHENAISQDRKTIKSIKVLLNLYVKIYEKDCKTNVRLPVGLLFKSFKKMLCCSGESCDHSDKNTHLELLSILHDLFKLSCFESASEAVEELMELYCYNLTFLNTATIKKEYQDCVMFKLKIIRTVYVLLGDFTQEANTLNFDEQLKLNNFSEIKVLTNLIIKGEDSLAVQALMFLIPAYITYCKHNAVLKVIWEEISSSFSSLAGLSRAMLILCNFFDIFFNKVECQNYLISLLFNDVNYWKLVQSALVEEDTILQKQGLYLLKKTVDVLNSSTETVTCCHENLFFYWDLICKNELSKLYSEIIIILEFLDEQQVHIIMPIFKLAQTLQEKIIQCNKVSLTWILLVYHKALIHNSAQVVQWGLSNLLGLPQSFFTSDDIAKKTVTLLVPILNSPGIYYNDGLAVSKELTAFLERISAVQTSRVFFNSFIKHICSLTWSPESLFFVTHAMSGFRGFSFWGEDEIQAISTFVDAFFITYHKIIKTGIQCELLSAITGLTDTKSVSLKSVVLLIARFPLMNSVQRESGTWIKITSWLRESYSEQEAEQLLESFKRKDLSGKFNEKSISIMFALFFDAFKLSNSFVMKHLSELLLLFRDIDRRLYCDNELYKEYLTVIAHMYEANTNYCIVSLEPLLKDVILYVRRELKLLSGLEEFLFYGRLYLNTIEHISKARDMPNLIAEEITNLYDDLLTDFKVDLQSNSNVPPLRLHCRIKLVNILLKCHPCESKLNFLASHMLENVSKPLEKEKTYSELTRDLQTEWGKINSEYIEGKWNIFHHLIRNKLIAHGSARPDATDWISDDDLVNLCIYGLGSGGYGVLCPVMSVLKEVLPTLENWSETVRVISYVYKLMMERKKTDEFKLFVKGFVEMLYQEPLIMKESAHELLIKYADLMFSYPSLAVVNIFMRHMQKIDLKADSMDVLCVILGKALIYGPVERRDEKLTTTVCSYIEMFRISPVWEKWSRKNGSGNRLENSQPVTSYNEPGENELQKNIKYSWSEKLGDHYTSNEVRARAIERILYLNKDSPTDRTIAKSLKDTLLKLESEANKQGERHFGNSHVHRVKHRVMQALLLLEPLLRDKDDRKSLFAWCLNGLLVESLQPSVRYLREWLLIRLMVEDEDSCSQFFHHFDISKNIKKTGLCSLMSIGLHLCQLESPEMYLENQIDHYIFLLIKYLLHQNFEVRLYAQVIIYKLYVIAKAKKFRKVMDRWESIYRTLDEVGSTMQDQRTRNLLKLEEDFFLSTFNPLRHYSLQMIYTDLPNLANVGSDEWISNQMFLYCGVDPSKISISFSNTDSSVENRFVWKRKMSVESKSDELGSEQILENYQRKIIPTKPRTTSEEEKEFDQRMSKKKDGLVVVASLIDRIPNLGGLARTCEIFGVSEYVIGSLKYMEDKQFTSLSVTAEEWITVKEVKEHNLATYILEMKQNGYVVVGAEQTQQSQSLSCVKFPKKTLLLLGNEKEGIPPNLLPFLDRCVEIPQMGIIRSLNVHVTGALFIWEYTKQTYLG